MKKLIMCSLSFISFAMMAPEVKAQAEVSISAGRMLEWAEGDQKLVLVSLRIATDGFRIASIFGELKKGNKPILCIPKWFEDDPEMPLFLLEETIAQQPEQADKPWQLVYSGALYSAFACPEE